MITSAIHYIRKSFFVPRAVLRKLYKHGPYPSSPSPVGANQPMTPRSCGKSNVRYKYKFFLGKGEELSDLNILRRASSRSGPWNESSWMGRLITKITKVGEVYSRHVTHVTVCTRESRPEATCRRSREEFLSRMGLWRIGRRRNIGDGSR